MARPITKFWLFSLLPGRSVSDPSFKALFAEILQLCSAYTNPDAGTPEMHVLYQSVDDASQLMMITGYQSQELNTEADTVYATKYMSEMFKFVQHVWLRQLDLDVRDLPLDKEQIIVTCSTDERVQQGGVGGWDVWPAISQARANKNALQVQEGDSKERVWIQVSEASQAVTGNNTQTAQFMLKKILGR
jgi:hypothetical protein